MQQGYVLGIDIGTTFTAAAVGRDGRATVCTLGTRAQSIPTVVAASPDGQLVVGEAAERRATTDPGQVAREFKRRLGDTTPLVLAGHSYSPQALMAQVLRFVVREVTLAEDGPPAEVVLTHPAHFGPYKRELMQEVIRLADVDNARLITEPEAAAIAYAQKATIEPGRTVAVYDLGGGTFDAALVRRTPAGGFELVGAADGIDRLGGIDFDQTLMELVIEGAGLSMDDLDQADPDELVALRTRCRDAKEALSVDQSVGVRVGFGASRSVTVRRDEFAAAIKSRVLETVESMQRVIRSSGVESDNIDRVLLVGGSSRIPLVAELVRTRLSLPIAVDANPKYAICTGAALPQDMATIPDVAERAVETESSIPSTRRAATTEFNAGNATSNTRNNKKRNTGVAIGVVAVLAVAGVIFALTRGDDPPRVAGKGSTPETVARPTATHPVATSPSVAATEPVTAVTVPVTAPVTAPVTNPATTPDANAVTVPMDAAISLRGISYRFSQLVFSSAQHAVELSLEATSSSRGTVEPTQDRFSLRLSNGDYFSLDLQLANALSGAGSSSAGTLSSTSVPDGFTVDGSQLVLGELGDHQSIIDFNNGGARVLEDLAPSQVAISGTATTNLGVAFTARSAQLVAWRCEGSSADIRFVRAPLDEYSLVISGDLTVGASQPGGTTITDASNGFTRLRFPDGTTVEAATTIDDVLEQGDTITDGRICFNGLTFPLAGQYEFELLSGGAFDVGMGTLPISIPEGVSVVEDTSTPLGEARPMDAYVWLRGLIVHLQQATYVQNQSLVQMTADVTNTARAPVNDGDDKISLRFEGVDYPVNLTAASPLTGEVTTRVDLRAPGLPANFDITKAQLVGGDAGSHQGIIDLGTGTPVDPVDPVDVPVDASLDTNYGVAFHATGAQIVPWACSGGSDRIQFTNSPATEFSLLVKGDLTVAGPTLRGGTTVTPVTRGFTRLVLPDGTTVEAATTIEDRLETDDQYGDARVCFSGLVAPFAGDYTLQMSAGSPNDSGGRLGELTITVPAGVR